MELDEFETLPPAQLYGALVRAIEDRWPEAAYRVEGLDGVFSAAFRPFENAFRGEASDSAPGPALLMAMRLAG